VVVVTDPGTLVDGPVVDVDEAGTVVCEEAGALTAKFVPVTTTTSAPADAGSDDPTSMVLVVEPPVVPADVDPVPAVTSPGS
jgi:hypothetical protein